MKKFYLLCLLSLLVCCLCSCKKDKKDDEVETIQEQIDFVNTEVEPTSEPETTSSTYVGFDLIEGNVYTDTKLTFNEEDGWLCYEDDSINFRVFSQRQDYDFSLLVNYFKDNNFTGDMSVNEFDISNPDYVEELVYFKITSNVPDFDGRYVYRSYLNGDELYIYLWNDGTLTHYLYTPEFE